MGLGVDDSHHWARLLAAAAAPACVHSCVHTQQAADQCSFSVESIVDLLHKMSTADTQTSRQKQTHTHHELLLLLWHSRRWDHGSWEGLCSRQEAGDTVASRVVGENTSAARATALPRGPTAALLTPVARIVVVGCGVEACLLLLLLIAEMRVRCEALLLHLLSELTLSFDLISDG